MQPERGRDLDAAIHEDVFGRPVYWMDGEAYDHEAATRVDPYSTDASVARLVLAEIERQTLEYRCLFVQHLAVLTGLEYEISHAIDEGPETVCRAALNTARQMARKETTDAE